jgi:hypothetical protein
MDVDLYVWLVKVDLLLAGGGFLVFITGVIHDNMGVLVGGP